MDMRKGMKRRVAAEVSSAVGFCLTVFGVGLLVASSGGASRVASLPAALCVAVGSLLAIAAARLGMRSRYVFFAAFLIQLGILLLLDAAGILQAPLSKLWPLASVFAGTSLFPAGWHRFGSPRPRFVVPGLGFVFLGAFFLVFSLGVVPFGFRRFFLDWWHLLVVFVGVLLTLASLAPRGEGPEEPGS